MLYDASRPLCQQSQPNRQIGAVIPGPAIPRRNADISPVTSPLQCPETTGKTHAMNTDLSGRHALVCGASRGIGRAVAAVLAGMGAAVTVTARHRDALDEVVAGLAAPGEGQHHAVTTDFSDPEGAADVLAGHLDGHPAQILVNNTGGPPPGPVNEASVEALRQGFDAHVVCNQLLARAALPGMRAAGYGRIVNIISTSVYEPIAGLGVSNTVRAAVAGWAKTLSTELAPEGFTVNNVLPGFTATDRLDSLIRGRSEASGRSEREVADGMRSLVPMARFAEPEEVAAAVAFLASPAAAYITGVSLPVDGGRLKSI